MTDENETPGREAATNPTVSPWRPNAWYMAQLERSGLYWRVWAFLSGELVDPIRDERAEYRAFSAAECSKAIAASHAGVARAYRQLAADGMLLSMGKVKGRKYMVLAPETRCNPDSPPKGYVKELARREEPFLVDQEGWEDTALGGATGAT